MTVNEIIKEIIDGNFTKEELSSIYSAYSDAEKMRRAKDNAMAKSALRVGMVGTLQGLKPAKYNGMKVVVTKINKSRVEVKEEGKEFSWGFTVPATCIQV
jgi:hypothetical protein